VRKSTVEESLDLTVFYLRKQGLLTGHVSTTMSWKSSMTGKVSTIGLTVSTIDEPCVRFNYTAADREGYGEYYDYKVNLVTTPCNLGGVRYWFMCPSCYRRVGGLYLAPGRVCFECRLCSDLMYQSCRRSKRGMEALGEVCRQVDELRGQMRRWRYRGRETKKVKRLRALEYKAAVLSRIAYRRLDRLTRRPR
jgi:hypothetical protein